MLADRTKTTLRIREAHRLEIERLLKLHWRPEQIAWRLYQEQGYLINHEWIYQYICQDKRQGGQSYQYLRCQKKRRKRYGSNERRGQIPNQRMIDERPSVVDRRNRIGDWEGDTIVGKGHQGVLISLNESKSRYTLLGHSRYKSKFLVADEVIKRLSGYKDRVKTITYDNGREFTDHERIAEPLSMKVYYAHPYSSWERGTNEYSNGLV